MEKKGTNTVKVVVPEYGMEQTLEVSHAERLLAMPNNGGWILPKDSPFIFDLDNGIRRKTNTRDSKKA